VTLSRRGPTRPRRLLCFSPCPISTTNQGSEISPAVLSAQSNHLSGRRGERRCPPSGFPGVRPSGNRASGGDLAEPPSMPRSPTPGSGVSEPAEGRISKGHNFNEGAQFVRRDGYSHLADSLYQRGSAHALPVYYPPHACACVGSSRGGQGESLGPPYTCGSVYLSLTHGGQGESLLAWCLLIHAEASLSFSHPTSRGSLVPPHSYIHADASLLPTPLSCAVHR
jgi:hypothetical protein